MNVYWLTGLQGVCVQKEGKTNESLAGYLCTVKACCPAVCYMHARWGRGGGGGGGGGQYKRQSTEMLACQKSTEEQWTAGLLSKIGTAKSCMRRPQLWCGCVAGSPLCQKQGVNACIRVPLGGQGEKECVYWGEGGGGHISRKGYLLLKEMMTLLWLGVASWQPMSRWSSAPLLWPTPCNGRPCGTAHRRSRSPLSSARAVSKPCRQLTHEDSAVQEIQERTDVVNMIETLVRSR